MDEYYCPNCGEQMEHWNQGILQCPECGCMVDSEVLDEWVDSDSGNRQQTDK